MPAKRPRAPETFMYPDMHDLRPGHPVWLWCPREPDDAPSEGFVVGPIGFHLECAFPPDKGRVRFLVRTGETSDMRVCALVKRVQDTERLTPVRGKTR